MPHKAWSRFQKEPADVFYREAARVSPRAGDLRSTLSFPDNFFYHERPLGHAKQYVDHGAALIGDAAHPVTPVGGQGANMAIADAVALGETALEAFDRNDFSSRYFFATRKRIS